MGYSHLTQEQQEAIDFLYDHDNILLPVKMGFGKTVVALTAIQELLGSGAFKRFLVVAPLKPADMTWGPEPGKWGHLAGLQVGVATGNPKQRRAVIDNADNKIVVINFENLVWFFNTYPDHDFDGLCIDELTKLKNVGGVQFRKLRPHLDDFGWRCGMTGTLTEEGLPDLYGMMMVIDVGKTLGRNKDTFLRKYFKPDFNGYNWTPFPDTSETLARLIRPLCPTLDIAQYEDGLPVLTPQIVTCTLPPMARAAYDEMRRGMLLEIEDKTIPAVNAAVLSGKLQQIATGFCYHEDGDGAAAIHAEKLETVARLVRDHEDSGREGGILVVYTHIWELTQLRAMFPDAQCLGAGVSRAKSTQTEHDWNLGEIPVLFIHPRSGGHGLNLQRGGSHVIFVSPIWSKDQTDQVIARLRRRGQKAADVLVTTVCGLNTVDDTVVLPRLAGKGEGARLFTAHLGGV